jgi:hypothetical protein
LLALIEVASVANNPATGKEATLEEHHYAVFTDTETGRGLAAYILTGLQTRMSWPLVGGIYELETQ